MTLRLIQSGRGETRDLLVVFHLDPMAQSIQRRICAAMSDA